VFFTVNNITPDAEFSSAERRRLAAFPPLSAESVFNNEFFTEFEKYAADQFVFREGFRNIKANFSIHVMRRADNNGIFVLNGGIFKMEHPTDVQSVDKFIGGINGIREVYLDSGMNVYFSIIPDKNYFAARQNGYLSLDYEYIEGELTERVEGMGYIRIMDILTLDDYYRTDSHWRQENLLPLADHIAAQMNPSAQKADVQYTRNRFFPFYGVFHRQSALGASVRPDELIYLTSEYTDNATVYMLEQVGNQFELVPGYDVYATDKLTGNDPYDVFLHGAAGLIVLENKGGTTGRELFLFRDSFGSSIAPLLLPYYDKITVIDTRYPSGRPRVLSTIIDFAKTDKEVDVLFLFSTLAINDSGIFFL
jgi:hypothetical protein